MNFPNIFLHIRTSKERHKVLIETMFHEAYRIFGKFKENLDILIVGPGGEPIEEAPKSLVSKLVAPVVARAHQKDGVHALRNYEPEEMARIFGSYFTPRLTVMDMYAPCTDCVPDSFSFTYSQPALRRQATVPVRKFVHNVAEPLPAQAGEFDVILSAIALDRLAGDADLLRHFTPYRQSAAVRNLDARLRPGGLWGVTTGQGSPNWPVMLGSANYIRRGKMLPPQYQLWRKNPDQPQAVRPYFRPPHETPVDVNLGGGKTMTSDFPDIYAAR